VRVHRFENFLLGQEEFPRGKPVLDSPCNDIRIDIGRLHLQAFANIDTHDVTHLVFLALEWKRLLGIELTRQQQVSRNNDPS